MIPGNSGHISHFSHSGQWNNIKLNGWLSRTVKRETFGHLVFRLRSHLGLSLTKMIMGMKKPTVLAAEQLNVNYFRSTLEGRLRFVLLFGFPPLQPI
jgi:hypothetical protein